MQTHVLVLNRLYVAVHVVAVRRAFALLWKGLAEVVGVENGSYLSYDLQSWLEISELKTEMGLHENGSGGEEDWVRAVDFAVQVPRVIRLLEYDRIPKSVVKFNRRNVFLRDENRCQYCQGQFSHRELSLDHVVPRSRGGETSWENIVAACQRCNVRKGGRTPQEAGMRLLRRPFRPKRNPVLNHHLGSRKYACWRNFLR